MGPNAYSFLNRASRQAAGNITGFLGEVFGAVQAVKVANAETPVVEHLHRLNEQRKRETIKDTLFGGNGRRRMILEPDGSSTKRAPTVVMIGLSNMDYLFQVERFPPEASRTPARTFLQQGGGPAATAAVAAARLGGNVELWALHGEDTTAEFLELELTSYGVQTHRIQRVPGARTWVSAVLVTPQGERYIFPYRDAHLQNAEGWNPTELPDAGCILTDARHPAQTEPVLQEARRRGIPIVGDFSNGSNWHLAAYCDHLIVSEECALEVAGTVELGEALQSLRQREDQVVGVTLGERGYHYLDGHRAAHVPAFVIDAVDTTGAGDVFHGAYAYGVAIGWPVPECAVVASAAAALKCTRLGGRTGIPTLDEVRQLRATRT
jgi:sulfofructose kinase